jgi:TRAP-type mannitol/chloroaromatic compound transport system permease small subunit
MKKIVAFIDKTNEWVGRVSSWSVIILALIVTYEVIMRYVFNKPSLGGFEYTKYIYAFHFMIVAGFALLHNSHANIDIFHSQLSEKNKLRLDLISYLFFFFPLCGVLLYFGTIFAWESWMFKETSWSIVASPVYPVKTVIPVSIFLLLIQGISVFYKKVVALKGVK